MPDITAPDLNAVITEAEKALREGAYVAVGLGVLAFQRTQVRRRELAEQLGGDRIGQQLNEVAGQVGTNVAAARAHVVELVKAVDEWTVPGRHQLDEQLDAVAGRLPEPARDVLHTVRGAVAGSEARLRAAVGLR
ncbi:MAG TPA: hypothetical protein VKV25_06010 [Acidimicrobiales bacterium]|nr:hypothetical protein [Acidimicrobiales bacterium]